MMSSGRSIMPPEKITFQRRSEQLDWKRIASIDIDSLIQEGDTTQLLELIKPITFCKADTEFDDGKIKIDPAFIKVFRISQLISQFLLASQENSNERLANLKEKYNETEKEKEKLFDEILHLKDVLASAKKELKKRKEMLATTQNEMLGENNSDEYDKCPYCSKKFVRPGYLLDHIQRRHQGLPANPVLYPSLLPGSATVLCHHSHPQTSHTSHHPWSPHQQTPASGNIFDPNVSLPPQSSQQVQTMMNHQIFPGVHTPSPSILHSNNQVLPSNLSFSGSVTSLNNLPSNQNPDGASRGTNSGANLGKRESFTQTSVHKNENYVELKHSSHLELLPEEMLNNVRSQQQDEPSHASDKHSPDSLNQLPNIMDSVPLASSTPLPNQHLHVDGSQPSADDDGGGDAAGMVNTSTLRSWERVEATKEGNVFRVPNQQQRIGLLEEEKTGGRQNGMDGIRHNAMISTNTTEGPTRFPINSSQSCLREDGEVTKSPADVINHPQFGRDSEKEAKDFAELKRVLQASVQGELKSLISRLESQEQFWQDKLALLQQDHERQIQQLRHELKLQNGTRGNNNRLISDENGVISADDKLGEEREIRHSEKERNNEDFDSSSGNVPPPPGIILVGPKGSYQAGRSAHQQFESKLGSSHEDPLHDDNDKIGESHLVPIAKPRKSRDETGKKVTHSYSDTRHMSSPKPSPVSTRVHEYHPIIQHHQQYQETSEPRQQHKQHGGTMAELQSLSESDPEFLTIIQPEEFHQGKHDNSIVPNSSDASATSTSSGTVAANNKVSQQQHQSQRYPVSFRPPPPKSGSLVVAGMNKSGSRKAEEEMAATLLTTEVKSNEVSDYTLSDSVDTDDADERNNDIRAMSSHKNDRQQHQQQQHQKRNHHVEFSNQSRGKSSVKPAPARKKYIFDAEARKIVEVSPDDDDEDDDEEGDEHSDNNGDLNNTSSADDDSIDGKKKKSQLDLVRAKTIMELEQNMSDIGLNPASTAIGMEEMKRALKHLKAQQRASPPDQIHDYERFEEVREAVKSNAKFEATKSSIDEKLDALSTLSSKKSQQNSLVKIFSAVKSSGRNFGKRVASAVKKKHKSEHGSGDDEEKVGSEKRTKRKPSSAPAMKTTFFSKARWTRKKKSDGKKGGAAALLEKQSGEGQVGNTSDLESSESEEEVELPLFMRRSSHQNRRAGSSSRSSERHASSGPSRHNSVRSKRSGSRPKSVKPLKRLNSSAGVVTKSTLAQQLKSSASATTARRRHSSESSPFSNVDECYNDRDENDIGGRSSMSENSVIEDNENAEQSGNHSNHKTQGKRKQQHKGNKEPTNPRRHQRRNSQENTSEDEDDDNEYMDDKLGKKETVLKRTGRKESQEDDGGERRVEDVCSSSRDSSSSSGESQSEEEDWDDDEKVSFATSNEILVNAKSSGLISSVGRHHNDKADNEEKLKHVGDNKNQIEVMGMSRYYSVGKSNSVTRESKNWNDEEPDTRLKEIKQYVSKSKKEVTRDETSSHSEEEDSGAELDARLEQREGKSSKHTHYTESKHNYPRERKMAFMENNDTHFLPKSASNALQRWATSTNVEEEGKRGQQQLEPPVLSHFLSSGQTNTNTQSGHGTISEVSTRKRFQLDGKNEKDDTRFLASTPLRKVATVERGQNETVRRQLENSFDEMNDLDDLLNTTFSDDDKTEERLQPKNTLTDTNSNQPKGLEASAFKRKPAATVMQPTNHHHLSGLGMANLRSKAEAQNKLLQESVRGSPTSRNSWDSQK